MQTFINKAGLWLVESGSRSGRTFRLYIIRDREGQLRWAWNGASRRPYFLKFYAQVSWRGKLFAALVEFVFLLRLQHLYFRRGSVEVMRDPSHPLYKQLGADFALFTGTPGPNRKMLLYAPGASAGEGVFVKIALTATSAALLRREEEQVSALGTGRHFGAPRVRFSFPGLLGVSEVGAQGVRLPGFTAAHAAALSELCAHGRRELAGSSLSAQAFAALERAKQAGHPQMPQGLLGKAERLAGVLAAGTVHTSWAHRDFTPWNCFLGRKGLALYDLEWAAEGQPLGYDAFHFVMQQGILVAHKPWPAIKSELESAFRLFSSFAAWPAEICFERYLSYYLLLNTAAYLEVYAQQPVWHRQVEWLLSTWSEALSDMLQAQANPRGLLIAEIFDHLRGTPYAAIKFPNATPSALPEGSDIDLCIGRADAERLLKRLGRHCLVQGIQLKRTSFMASALLVLKDGSLLPLDLIWQFKRRGIQYMDAAEVLAGSSLNAYGVKMMSIASLRDYLARFYGLNGSAIPAKYAPYFPSGRLPELCRAALGQAMKQAPWNSGLKAWANRWRYCMDTLRGFWHRRGLVVTFSGVDGAGKSTIIARVQESVEKRLRKRVVVIRHRPSLLPILSAITLGRAKAEQRAASTLPRQGRNRSAISSLLRFAYYYSDYLLGQFVIYVKHVLRGEVVLYDRYYFDFIVDGARSNIRLPRWLLRAGYALLLKPDLNFFLYADAATILERKQELKAADIQALTAGYLSLFEELRERPAGHYLPIENTDLVCSISLVSAEIERKIIGA